MKVDGNTTISPYVVLFFKALACNESLRFLSVSARIFFGLFVHHSILSLST